MGTSTARPCSALPSTHTVPPGQHREHRNALFVWATQSPEIPGGFAPRALGSQSPPGGSERERGPCSQRPRGPTARSPRVPSPGHRQPGQRVEPPDGPSHPSWGHRAVPSKTPLRAEAPCPGAVDTTEQTSRVLFTSRCGDPSKQLYFFSLELQVKLVGKRQKEASQEKGI